MSEWLDAEGHAERAFELFERGRWAEAESELRKALALNPDQAQWHFNLGLTLEAAGRDADALNSYERAAALMPDAVEPLISAGVVANRLGQYESAVESLERALQLDRTVESTYPNLMESYLRLGRHDDVEVVFYLGQQTLEEPSPHCLAMLGESLLQRDQHARAGWCFREALRLEPGLPRIRARLGTVYAAEGRHQRALQMYLRDLRDDPGNVDTLLDYGELLMELRRLPEAAEKFRRVLEMEPANVDAHYRLGEIAMRNSRFEQAHLEFELVLKLDHDYPQIRLSIADALRKRGRVEHAARWLREELDSLAAADSGPNDEYDLARLGELLLLCDRARDAVGVLDQAVEREPMDADLWRKLALARYQSGDRDGGKAASRRVLRLDPKCAKSMHNLALAALEDGRVAHGLGWVRRGLALDRHDDELRRLRARLWWVKFKRAIVRPFRTHQS